MKIGTRRWVLLLAISACAYPSFAQPSTDVLNLGWRDLSIRPSDNFYAYANGTWQRTHPIAPEYSRWDQFRELDKITHERLRLQMQNLATDRALKQGSIQQQIGDFYFTAMNLPVIEQQDVLPLKPVFDQINAIKTYAQLQQSIALLQAIGVDVLFHFGSMQDYKHSENVIAAAIQGGLGLPDRDYYLKTDQKSRALRSAYQDHIVRTFVLLGDTHQEAVTEANAVIHLETLLAKASMTRIAQRDPHAVYHLESVAQWDAQMPNWHWDLYLKTRGLAGVTQLNLGMPDFFMTINRLITEIPYPVWKSYLRWQVIDTFAPYLSARFVDEDFRMDALLTGAKSLLPRWQRVVNTISSSLDFAVGRLYVEKYLSKEDINKVTAMVEQIRGVFKKILQTTPWMSSKTRLQALKKLDKIEVRVGAPTQWRDYSSLVIGRNSYVLNVIAANRWNIRRDLAKIGKPLDRQEWSMPPQGINAYYDPSMNNITLLAGILQPPFYNPAAPASMNYGAVGFIIGHELTHGFDDEGSQFDADGNLKNWWTPDDKKRFKQATQCINRQFSRYTVNGELALQGGLVVGEATADLGGLLLAHAALHASGVALPTIGGLTPDQQFFLSAAHVWAGNIRPELARQLVMVDPHPPMINRVNGTLVNIAAFQSAYGIDKNSAMANQAPCVIW